MIMIPNVEGSYDQNSGENAPGQSVSLTHDCKQDVFGISSRL